MYNQNHNMQQYKAYATANMTVGKIRQVVMLYDGAIRFVQQAGQAIEREDYETRFNLLIKVSEIVSGLQSSLDFDNGGDIAQLLYDYYASLDARIFSVHRSNDMKMLEGVTKELRMMRDAWHEIDQADSAKKRQAAQTHESVDAPLPTNTGASGYSASVSA